MFEYQSFSPIKLKFINLRILARLVRSKPYCGVLSADICGSPSFIHSPLNRIPGCCFLAAFRPLFQRTLTACERIPLASIRQSMKPGFDRSIVFAFSCARILFKIGTTPTAASSRPEALTKLAGSSRFFNANKIDDFAARHVKTQANGIFRFHK